MAWFTPIKFSNGRILCRPPQRLPGVTTWRSADISPGTVYGDWNVGRHGLTLGSEGGRQTVTSRFSQDGPESVPVGTFVACVQRNTAPVREQISNMAAGLAVAGGALLGVGKVMTSTGNEVIMKAWADGSIRSLLKAVPTATGTYYAAAVAVEGFTMVPGAMISAGSLATVGGAAVAAGGAALLGSYSIATALLCAVDY